MALVIFGKPFFCMWLIVSGRALSAVIGDVVLSLRQEVFEATIGHDLSFYDEHPSGKIVS